jgi:hypothetical protein
VHDHFRARTADRFVTPQQAVDSRRTVVGVAFVRPEGVRQRDGVFERLRRSLPRVWQHRVRGVPEQRDRSASPPLDRIAIQELVQTRLCRLGCGDDGAQAVIKGARAAMGDGQGVPLGTDGIGVVKLSV